MVDPISAPPMRATENPLMWNMGETPMLHPAPAGPRFGLEAGSRMAPTIPWRDACIIMWMWARWDNTAPFGRPVVPLVNRMHSGSSSEMLSGGRERPRPAASSPSSSSSKHTTGTSTVPGGIRSRRRRSPKTTFG